MNTEERRGFILSKIETAGSVRITELAQHFHVSEMTIRRDLLELEKVGTVRRVHGGAVNPRGRSYEPPFYLRATQAAAEKQRIGRLAAEWVLDGDSIALDVGSTTMELARNLNGRQNITVITPSLHIAYLLADRPAIRLVVSGGILRQGEASLVGDLAMRTFDGLFVDKLFLAVGGVDAHIGLTEYNWEDTLLKRAMIRSAKQVIVVTDARKFNRVAFALIAQFNQIHCLITDQRPPEDVCRRLDEAGVTLQIAP